MVIGDPGPSPGGPVPSAAGGGDMARGVRTWL